MACAEHFQLTLASENGLRLLERRSLVQPLSSVDDVPDQLVSFGLPSNTETDPNREPAIVPENRRRKGLLHQMQRDRIKSH